MIKAEQDASQPTKIDELASQACTRSGAFALLLALFLGSLNPYWLQAEKDIAFDRYLSLRLNLDAAIRALDDDFIWQRYKASHEQAESMRLAQLIEAEVTQGGAKEASPGTTREKPAAKTTKK